MGQKQSLVLTELIGQQTCERKISGFLRRYKCMIVRCLEDRGNLPKRGKKQKQECIIMTQCWPRWYLTGNILGRRYSQYLMSIYVALPCTKRTFFPHVLMEWYFTMDWEGGLVPHCRPGYWFSAASSGIMFQGHQSRASAHLDKILKFCVTLVSLSGQCGQFYPIFRVNRVKWNHVYKGTNTVPRR